MDPCLGLGSFAMPPRAVGAMAQRRVRRRIAAERESSPEPELHDFDEFSALISHLLLKWAWGRTPASEVQALAKAALRDFNEIKI